MSINYLVRQENVKIPNKIEMQIIDIFDEDFDDESYIVNLFGITKEGYSVHIQANDFKPFFYIKVPKDFQKQQVYSFIEFLTEKYFNKVDYQYKIIEEAKLVKRIDFRGFRNGNKDKFIKLFFKTKKHFTQMRYFLKNYNDSLKFQGKSIYPRLYESNMDPFLSLFHLRDIKTAGWIEIDNFTKCSTSKCQIDIQANWEEIKKSSRDDIGPILQASFDIECVAEDGVSFPEWRKEKDVINQIGTTMYIYGKDNIKPFKHIVSLKSCDKIDGAIVESYKTESDLLIGWVKLLERIQPDILTGYNIYGFDYEYIYQRAKKLGISHAFKNLSKLKNYESPKNKDGDFLCIKELSSSALGDNKLKYLSSPGIVHIDLLKVIQREYKLESYKLDNVASEFIKGKIKKVEFDETQHTTTFTINPNDILDIELGNYIGIRLNKLQYHEEENSQKWKVIEIKGNTITINSKLSLPENILLEWTLKKDDLDAKELFAYQKKDSAHRKQIAIYCLQDNILCNKLLDKLRIITNNIGMANVCSVPISYIFLRGQGIKAYSLVGKQCKEDGYLIPDVINNQNYQSFQGATVLSAKIGAHFTPVACNDFSSLYPSSIISHNLSPDTLIEEDRHFENVATHDIRWEDRDDNGIITNTYCYTFTTPDGEDNHDAVYQSERKGRGIIPRVLIKLLKNRKDVKKKMENETDPFKKSLLDGLQLSYKLTCNSIYGQMGSSYSPISCMPVAMCTTSVGRQLLEKASQMVKEIYPDSKLVYGDSVVGDTPLLLRNSEGKIIIKTIEELADNWTSYEELKPFDTIESNRREKEQASCELEVWSKDGWNTIKRVIRHKCNKRILRVNTHCGVIDVTEDHSLIHENGNKLKPIDCVVNETKLLQSYPTFITDNNAISISKICEMLANFTTISNKKAFLYGFFYADGSICASGNKYSWALYNKNYEYCEGLKMMLESVYNNKFKILDTFQSSGVYKIVPIGGIKQYVEEYRQQFYNHKKYKIIPDNILYNTYDTRLSFFLGYYLGDGFKSNKYIIRLTNKGKIGSMQLYYLLKSLGYKVSITTRTDKLDCYRLTATNFYQRKSTNIVKKILDLGRTEQFVYDLETKKGTFHGGVGEICLFNTDSIMVKYNIPITCEETEEKVAYAIKCAKTVENRVSEVLPWPHKLEYEKTYYPYILLSKKRYMGVMYEFDPQNYTKVDSKGIVLKRRDNAKIVKYIYGGALDIILFKRNTNMVYEFVRETFRRLLKNEFSYDLLVISKALKKTKTIPAHRMLANRIAKRDPGNAPQLNDRIPYIYVYIDEKKKNKILQEQGRKKLLQGDMIETPTYIKEQNLKPDFVVYITNQIMKPLLQLLTVLVNYEDPNLTEEELQTKKEDILKKELFAPFIIKAIKDQTGQSSINDFF